MFLCFKDLSHKTPMFFQRNYTLVKGNWGNCYEWNYTPGWNILLNASNIVKPPLLLTHSYRLNAEYTIKLLQWDKDLKLIDRYFFLISSEFCVDPYLWMWLSDQQTMLSDPATSNIWRHVWHLTASSFQLSTSNKYKYLYFILIVSLCIRLWL